jgi:hypothetical protein
MPLRPVNSLISATLSCPHGGGTARRAPCHRLGSVTGSPRGSRKGCAGLKSGDRRPCAFGCEDAAEGSPVPRCALGEAVLAYKPAPEVYQLALDTAGCPPERVLMVAAHAWDLRGVTSMVSRRPYVTAGQEENRPPGTSAPRRYGVHLRAKHPQSECAPPTDPGKIQPCRSSTCRPKCP